MCELGQAVYLPNGQPARVLKINGNEVTVMFGTDGLPTTEMHPIDQITPADEKEAQAKARFWVSHDAGHVDFASMEAEDYFIERGIPNDEGQAYNEALSWFDEWWVARRGIRMKP